MLFPFPSQSRPLWCFVDRGVFPYPVPHSGLLVRVYASRPSIAHMISYTRLVLETLEPLAEDRKCFRLINGVLVERTVKDVVPALQTNQDGLKKVLDDLVKQYKTKQDELDKWKVCSFPSLTSFDSPSLDAG